MVQCQNIVYTLNQYDIKQPEQINLEMLTSDHDKSETQSDVVEKLIQVETEEIVVKGSTSQPFTS